MKVWAGWFSKYGHLWWADAVEQATSGNWKAPSPKWTDPEPYRAPGGRSRGPELLTPAEQQQRRQREIQRRLLAEYGEADDQPMIEGGGS